MTAKSCLSFLPYGWNDFYVHLPQNATFCVNQSGLSRKYITDNYGGRILSNELSNEKIQVFGDSQVLGLDVEKIEEHYLSDKYKNYNLIIYAAPNNGPYEVINFLNKNKKILKKKIIVTFNFAVDIYRVSNTWHPTNFVALKNYELDEILDHPFKYRLIIFKNLLFSKNFTIKKYNNKKMQNLFLNSNQDEVYNNLFNYFNELDKLANKNNLEVDFIVTHPYWLYSIDKKKDDLLLEENLNKKVFQLICKTFKETKNIKKILISKPSINFSLQNLTFDNRHIESKKIKLLNRNEVCKS